MKARWLGLAAVLLVGCGAAPVTPDTARPEGTDTARTPVASPSTTVPSGPQCLDPGVELSTGGIDGAMGLRAVGVTLRNCGASTYTVNGYPLIEVLDADGNVLEVTVLNGVENVSRVEQYAGPPQRIAVAPGGSVVALLLWRNLTTDAATVAKGAYLSIAPAGGQPRHMLPLVVDLGNTGRLAVSPWTSP